MAYTNEEINARAKSEAIHIIKRYIEWCLNYGHTEGTTSPVHIWNQGTTGMTIFFGQDIYNDWIKEKIEQLLAPIYDPKDQFKVIEKQDLFDIVELF
jgi:hypothetical protein